MPDAKAKQESETKEEETDPKPEQKAKSEQMCCDGERTAAEHRKESPDGKCCSD